MARYLVTGGAGFIGSHLTDSLVQAGHEVVVLDDFSSGKRENLNSQATIVEGSLLNRDLLDQIISKGVDGCFHLAAKPIVQETILNWKTCSEVNLLGTVNLFEALSGDSDTSIPVVYASSCAVYGASGTAGNGLKETDRIDPQSPYAVDKYACELHARAGGMTRGLKSLGARFFNVYGERQDPRSPYSGVVSKFSENLKQQLPLTIFGDGNQTRDFIHVSDIVRLLRSSIEVASTQAPVLNFGTGHSITINQLAETMMKAFGDSIPVVRKEGRLGEVRYSRANLDQLKALIGESDFGSLTKHVGDLLV